jgi:hypothetical protein
MTVRQSVNRSSSQWTAIYRLSPWKFWLTVVLVIAALALGSFYVPASH